MIWHVATFRLTDPSTADQAAKALWRLRDIVPGTIDYQVGISFIDTPTTAKVCAVGKFTDMQAFDAYMNHPVHTDEVAPLLAELVNYEIIERMVSCDFETD